MKDVAVKELGENYEVVKTSMQNPEIKIIGISDDLSIDEIKESIKTQNDFNINENTKIEVNFVKELQNKTKMAIVTGDSTTFSKIMSTGKYRLV